jgi:uncharacterized circularly permuted ATP-grasp superfamily protein
MNFSDYQTGSFFDEMFEAGCVPRPAAKALAQLIQTMTDGELQRRQQSAERALLHMGITFNVSKMVKYYRTTMSAARV